MSSEKVIIASGVPLIDRGTGARAKTSRKRFLAFVMVGIMIVSAVSMIASNSVENNGQDDGGDQIAKISWAPGGKREAIYKANHLFESYVKLLNFTKAVHGNGIGTQEKWLGIHSMTQMGQPSWSNGTGAVNAPRQAYDVWTLSNNYPYGAYYNPSIFEEFNPATMNRKAGLMTVANYRLSATVRNDTALKTGINDKNGMSRNVPFLPYVNRQGSNAQLPGGNISMNLYATYMSATETTALRAGTHFGNWFYGMRNGITPNGYDSYYMEVHGTFKLDHRALITFLGMPQGTADARTWFAANVGISGIPADNSILGTWREFMIENFSESGSAVAKWNNSLNNSNIYTTYECDFTDSGENQPWISMKLDPLNYTSATSLAIRVYYMGWCVDAALERMIEAANITGSLHNGNKPYWKINGAQAYWNNRATMTTVDAEDVYVNCSIGPRMANSTLREVTGMTNWEDDATDVWSGGYQMSFATHTDYIPAIAGGIRYYSPMQKYTTFITDAGPQGGGTVWKTYNWRCGGSTRFGENASVVAGSPNVRNLTAFEAIIVDLNLLSSPWLTNVKDRTGGQGKAMVPHDGTSDNMNDAKTVELNGYMYWGVPKLGKGSYPQAAILSAYNPATKILNLSGGTTGMAMPQVFNVDYWAGQAARGGWYGRIQLNPQPQVQIDISPVDHWDIKLVKTAGNPDVPPYTILTNYVVKVTPHNASRLVAGVWNGGEIPRTGANNLVVNETVVLSTNNPGATWPVGQPVPAIGNGTTVVFSTADPYRYTNIRFATVKANTYVNASGQWFDYALMGGLTEATFGTTGAFAVNPVPEFTTILIPIVGMMAMFFVLRTRKRKREE
jgi:hypothetical protein